MLKSNAAILLEIRKLARQVLAFSSPISREILLIVAGGNGTFELRLLYKQIAATPTAIRLHVQSLIEDGFVVLAEHDTNRRCKVVKLTAKGERLLTGFEQRVHMVISDWRAP